MKAPSLTYKGQQHRVEQRREFAFDGVIPWSVEVAGAWYAVADPSDDAARFLRERLRNIITPLPGLIASARYPVLVSVRWTAVRAWPAFTPRGRGSRSYTNPLTGDRVATVQGPLWMFEATGRPASPFGSVTGEQTIEDVRDLAALWLRST